MTALAVRTEDTTASAGENAELLTLVLHVSDNQKSWYRIAFEGESPLYLDKQAAAWLKDRPYLAVEMDEDSTCYSQFPRTFNAVFTSITRNQQELIQIVTI